MAVIAVVEVQLVEDSRSILDVVQQLGPLLVGGAAIFAAVIAWRSAGTRLEKQLANDREALEMQLSHDRQLRRDEYRLNALDSALELVNELAKGVQEAVKHHSFSEQIWSAADETLARSGVDEAGKERAKNAKTQVGKEFSAKVEAFESRLPELSAAITRLKLRFGSSHPIPLLAEASYDAWEVQRAKLSTAAFWMKPLSESEADEWKAASKTAAVAYADLMQACEEWLATGETA